MLLTVLGCSGSLSGPGNPCSCYLVQSGSDAVLLDLGTGSAGAVLESVRLPVAADPSSPPADDRCGTGGGGGDGDGGGTERPDLRAVVVSHLHGDHCGDLPSLAYAMGKHDEWGSGPPRQVPVVAPQGARPDVAPWLRYLAPGQAPPSVGSLDLQQAPGQHQVPSWATRVSSAGRSLVYTGDTGPSDEVVRLARGADVLVCEAALAGGAGRPAAVKAPATHLTPADAGRLAARAGCALLVLTHLRPWADRPAAITQAAAHFGGPVLLAMPGLRLSV